MTPRRLPLGHQPIERRAHSDHEPGEAFWLPAVLQLVQGFGRLRVGLCELVGVRTGSRVKCSPSRAFPSRACPSPDRSVGTGT